MTSRLAAAALLVYALLGAHQAAAQAFQRRQPESPLQLAVVQAPTSLADSVLLTVFARIPLERLVFLAQDDGFRAAYELSVFAVAEDKMVRGTRIWKESVIRTAYKDTQAEDEYHTSQASFVLPAGKYEIVANLWDKDSSQRYTAREQIEVLDYPLGELALGDAVLISGIERLPGQRDRLIPYLDNLVSDEADSFRVYLVVRNPSEDSTRAEVTYVLEAEKKDTLSDTTGHLMLSAGLSTHVIPFAASELKKSNQTLTIRLQVDSLMAERTVTIRKEWTGLASSIDDLDLAIRQTRYLASRQQLQKMRSSKGEAQREALMKFWQELDPSPGTPRNELMDEYYRRVAYADAHYRSFQPGWQTDLGMVYIIYGQPDDIERHPFDVRQKPYQIWFYYGKGWRFVFVDVNLFGDYRLTTPLYPTRTY